MSLRTFLHRTTISGRGRYIAWSLLCIAIGIGSRLQHSDNVVVDKYLGDGAYAVLIYLMISTVRPHGAAGMRALSAFAISCAIEFFQLTGVGASLRESGSLLPRLLGVVLGSGFSVLDIFAYAAGIALILLIDTTIFRSR